MSRVDMAGFGLTAFFADQAASQPELHLARIVQQDRGGYRAVCSGGEVAAEASGALLFDAASPLDIPAVGDFVLLDRADDAQGVAIIRRVLDRRSVFTRASAGKAGEDQVLAANIDAAFVCMSLNADFNVRRLERYLALAWEGGCVPVVVLTKADLCDDIERKVRAAEAVALGVDILVVSALDGESCWQVADRLAPGTTAALVGSSGVGKSTLVNWLLGEDRLKTERIRADGRGRHATTRRQLIAVPHAGCIIDTPGMREVGLGAVEQGLEQGFADVEAYFGRCRFRDCTHGSEPGCAVYEALAEGELSPQRWDAYRKLKAEAAYASDRRGYLDEKEKRFKDIAKLVKGLKRPPSAR